MLQDQGWKCAAVHGDKGQKDREDAVNAFKVVVQKKKRLGLWFVW
jgi:superfamily II DNA/RNA helicase